MGISIVKKILGLMGVFTLALSANSQDFQYQGMDFEVLEYDSDTMGVELVRNIDYRVWTEVELPSAMSVAGFSSFGEDIPRPAQIISIGPRAFYQGELRSIKLPESLQRIGREAFASTNLTDITIPGNVAYIGVSAFARARGLNELTLPESVLYIDFEAFEFTPLRSIHLPARLAGLGGNTFRYCHLLKDIYCSAPVPPKADPNDFCVYDPSPEVERPDMSTGPLNNKCYLHVPAESIELYKEAPGWSLFGDRIVALEDASEVTEAESKHLSYILEGDVVILSGTPYSEVNVYNLSGQKIASGKTDGTGLYSFTPEIINLVNVGGESLKILLP